MKARRLIVQAVAALAGGAVLSILIAQAAFLWSRTICVSHEWVERPGSEQRSPETNPIFIKRREWALARLPRVRESARRSIPGGLPPDAELTQLLETHLGPGVDVDHYVCWWDGIQLSHSNSYRRFVETRAGWPARCLSARSVSLESDPNPVWLDAFPAPDFLLPVPFMPTPPRAGPVLRVPVAASVQPLGLTLNACVYGSILFLATTGRGALVSHLRRRRNHCPSCNYDRTGLATGVSCPECGR